MIKATFLNRERIYLFGLILLAVGIPLSHIIMSIAQIILLSNWLIDKNLVSKIKLFYKNKPALIFSFIYFLHLAGLFFTSDFDYAIKDLRTKIPILFLPLVFSSSKQLSYNEIKIILRMYIASVIFGSLACSFVYLTQKIDDIRNISIFISHIRFSLNICLSICILFYYLVIKKEFNKKQSIIVSILIGWLILFIFILQSLTGIIILFLLALTYALFLVFTSHKIKTKFVVSISIVSILLLIFSLLHQYYQEYFSVKEINYSQLDSKTIQGNDYEFFIEQFGIENGNYIGLYICKKELADEWQKRSKIHIDSSDHKKQQLIVTLIRFLNSKGLRKDAEGVKSLNDKEITAIESGYANYLYLNDFSIKAAVYRIFFEYNNYIISGATKGYSIIQRYELWKAALGIIKENFWFGVGTGDMVTAYKEQLIKMNSDLKELNIRAHNQYLSIFSAFGIVGFLVFLFSYIYPIFISKAFNSFLFVSFFIISSLSMINEDTIETQTGVTFFAFFYLIFLLFNKNSDQTSE